MLRIARESREGLRVADVIDVQVTCITRRYSVQLRIVAPGSVGIWRAELSTVRARKAPEPASGAPAPSETTQLQPAPHPWSRPDRPDGSEGGLVLNRRRNQAIHFEGVPLIGRLTIEVGRIGVHLETEADYVELFIYADRRNSVERWERLQLPQDPAKPEARGPEAIPPPVIAPPLRGTLGEDSVGGMHGCCAIPGTPIRPSTALPPNLSGGSTDSTRGDGATFPAV